MDCAGQNLVPKSPIQMQETSQGESDGRTKSTQSGTHRLQSDIRIRLKLSMVQHPRCLITISIIKTNLNNTEVPTLYFRWSNI